MFISSSRDNRRLFSPGLELITQGSYKLEKEEGDDEKVTLTLTFSEDTTPHKFILWGNLSISPTGQESEFELEHSPIGETRTSARTAS